MDPHHHHHCHVIPTTTCCHTCYTQPQNPHFIHQNITYPNHINLQNNPFCQNNTYPHHENPQNNLFCQNSTYPHHNNPQNNPFHLQKQQFSQFSQYPNEQNDHATVSSLLCRISALESALRFKSQTGNFGSLKDAAARMIQVHFRAFLVRRSRTLRQLKSLSLIKSALVEIKLSVSGSKDVDYWVVSRKAMDLLLRIDSIQGGDSMIRDGKRSLSRELDRFLQLIDGFSDKRKKLSSIELKKSKTRVLYNGQMIDTAEFVISDRSKRGSKERANMYYPVPDNYDEDAGIIELGNFRVLSNSKTGTLPKRNGGLTKKHGGNICKAMKDGTFAENANRTRVFVNSHEPDSSEEDDSSDEEGKLADKFRGLNNGHIGSLPKRNSGLAKKLGVDLVKTKKNVTFAESGDLSKVFVNTYEPNSSEDGLSDEEGKVLDNLRRRVEKIAELSKENGEDDQEAYSEDEESSSQSGNGEENSKRVSKTEGNYVGNDNDFAFSAPMPVKMESKAELMKIQKA